MSKVQGKSDVAHLRGESRDGNAVAPQCQFGESAAYDPRECDAGRRASASSIVAEAVLLLIGIVGMGRTIECTISSIVLGTSIRIGNKKTNGCSRGLALKEATQQTHLVGLFAPRGERALTWATTVQLSLNEGLIDRYARRHAVDDATDSLAMALTKRSERVECTKRVAHRRPND